MPAETADTEPTKGFTEPRFSMDPRNPAGWLLHVRADTIEEFVEQINQLWDPHAGKREDLTNLILFSFNPAIVADMAAGRSAEEAMGYAPDDMATAAYNALAQGAQRAPAAASNGGGRPSGGGGGGAKPFTVAEVGADALPGWFLDELTREDLCKRCKDPEGKFFDNRGNDRNMPAFKCANKACTGGKDGKYAWGIYEPDASPRGSSSRTR